MIIYLAGPLGFTEAGRYFQNDVIIPHLKSWGHEILNPWELTNPAAIADIAGRPYSQDKRDAWKTLNSKIGATNVKAIDSCNAVFAVLDGTDVDSGTAAEIGYAAAKGKPVIGYRSDCRLAGDNEGAIINLQVEYFIEMSGGTILDKIEDTKEELDRIRVKLFRQAS